MSERSKPIAGGKAGTSDSRTDGGVDVTLIRWMLSLTPAQRLQVLQRNVEFFLKLPRAQPIKKRKS